MGTVANLYHVNGGVVRCTTCETELGRFRVVQQTVGGLKFFCPFDEDEEKYDPKFSCFNQWLRKQPKVRGQ